MGFIPNNACWYLADIVLEHTIEGDPRNVVHVNTHLIEAKSFEAAYRKARALGRKSEMDYLNSDGKKVNVTFRGLRELNVIHDVLKDGAELSYEESVVVPEDSLKGWARPKRKLAVFAPIQASTAGPNYMPQSIMMALEEAGFSRSEIEGRAEQPTRSDS